MNNKTFNYSVGQKLLFYLDYAFSKLFVNFFLLKDRRIDLSVVEFKYILSKFNVIDKDFYRDLSIQRVVSSNGNFLIRPHTFDIISALPTFEHRDIRKAKKMIGSYLKAGKSVLFIDVGADFGTYTIALGNFFKNYDNFHIVAFEPSDDSYSLLLKNCKKNKIKADIKKLALSNSQGETKYYFNPDQPGTSGLDSKNLSKNTLMKKVRISTLDLQLEKIAPKYDVSFIKVDVEGHEIKVLRGAEKFMKKYEWVLVIEDFVDPKVIQYLSRYRFIAKLSPYNSWWLNAKKN